MAIVVSAQDLEAGFGARPLFDGVSFTVEEASASGSSAPTAPESRPCCDPGRGRLDRQSAPIARRRGLRAALARADARFAEWPTVRRPSFWRASATRDGPPSAHERTQVFATLALDGRRRPGARHADCLAVRRLEEAAWRSRAPRRPARPAAARRADEPPGRRGDRMARGAAVAPRAFATIRSRTTGCSCSGSRRASWSSTAATRAACSASPATTPTTSASRPRHARAGAARGGPEQYVRRETEWLRPGRGRPQTKHRRHRARRHARRRGRASWSPQSDPDRTLDFAAAEARPRRLMEAARLRRSTTGARSSRGIDLLPRPRQARSACSAQRCGKSTLIRVLLGEEAPSAGTVARADGLQVAYFQQSREALDPGLHVADTLCPDGDYVSSAARACTSAATSSASCSRRPDADAGRQALGRRAEPPACSPS